MSDLAKALQKLSGSAQLVWLAHPYPPDGEIYEFLAQPETLKNIQQASPNLCLALNSSLQFLVDDYADGLIKPTELSQKIEDIQRDQKPEVSPALLAQLIMNAQKSGLKLQFIDGPKLSEFDQAHMQGWLDNAAKDRIENAGLLGILGGRLLNKPDVENEMITEALKNPKTYLGKAISDKVHWVNRGQIEVAENLLARLNGKSAVIVYPSETLAAIHNFDFALAQAAVKLEAERQGEVPGLSTPEELAHWGKLALQSAPTGLVRRMDLTRVTSGAAHPQSRVEQRLEQQASQSDLTPSFSFASGRVAHVAVDEGVEVPLWEDLSGKERTLAVVLVPSSSAPIPSQLNPRFQPKAQ